MHSGPEAKFLNSQARRARAERLRGQLTKDAAFTKVFKLLNLKLTAESAFIVQCPRLLAGSQGLQHTQKLSLSSGILAPNTHPTLSRRRTKKRGRRQRHSPVAGLQDQTQAPLRSTPTLWPRPQAGSTCGRFRASGPLGLVVSSEMSWVRGVPEVPSPGDQDVFDEEADETLLVQREWQGHMRRRIQVNGRGMWTRGAWDSHGSLGLAGGGTRGRRPGPGGQLSATPRLPRLSPSSVTWLKVDNL